MLAVGFGEEATFRGVVLQTLLPRGRMRAVLLSSVLYGVASIGVTSSGRYPVLAGVQPPPRDVFLPRPRGHACAFGVLHPRLSETSSVVMASSVEIQRGSVGAMNLQRGMSSSEASSTSVS
jgi:membrane protease YdiL (CAAX protease family)